MLKFVPFFFIFLPLLVVLGAWIFGKANLVGMLLAAVLYTAVLGFLLWFLGDNNIFAHPVIILLAMVSMWYVPWCGTLFSLSIPSPGPSPADAMVGAYNSLSPEEKEMAKRAGGKVLRGFLAMASVHLRKKGHHGIASAAEQLLK